MCVCWTQIHEKRRNQVLNILFTIDQNYIAQMLICVDSIVRFPTQGGYDFYILHSSLTKEDVETIRAHAPEGVCRFHFASVDVAAFEGFPETERYPKEMYYRILAADYLPQQLERALYLDPDIVVIKPLETLYQSELADNLFLATTHVNTFLTRVNARRLKLEEPVPYVNTGVLLLNLPAMRQAVRLEDIKAFVAAHGNAMTLPDQDVVTALYGKRVQLVDDMLYNLSDRMLGFYNARHPESWRDLAWVQENAVIIHYCGANKPWKEHYHGILDCFYHELAHPEKTETE